MSSQSTPPPFLSLRTALILLVAFFGGIIIGCCTYLAYGNPWSSVIAGLAAASTIVLGLHSLLEN